MDYRQLGKEYPAVSVYSDNSSLGCGNRIVYWVGSDGTRCVVYNCVGDLFVVPNEDLSFNSVTNAAAYSFKDGRLRFRNKGSVWIDGGPIWKSAAKPDDPSIATIKDRAGRETSLDELIDDAGGDTTWEDDEW